MGPLLYFAVWAVFVFLMMRYGCGAHIMGDHRSGGHPSSEGGDPGLRWLPPKTDADPVCGRSVATETAKSSVHAGYVYYFCSRDCREIFEAAPDLYVGDGHSGDQRPEHSHA